MTFRVTAVRPIEDGAPLPTIEEYMALAEAMHGESDLCNATYFGGPFELCEAREADIQDAFVILAALRKDGWRLVRDVNATEALGL